VQTETFDNVLNTSKFKAFPSVQLRTQIQILSNKTKRGWSRILLPFLHFGCAM